LETRETYTKYWQDNLKETDDVDGQGVKEKVISKFILKRVGTA
jgi:hypothetical protein